MWLGTYSIWYVAINENRPGLAVRQNNNIEHQVVFWIIDKK